MKKKLTLILLLSHLTTWHAINASEQAMQDLRTIIIQTAAIATYPDQQEQLYLNDIRILLDPAYLDLPVAERKDIDKTNEQFKQLHAKIGNTFIPILPQENIEKLKYIAAEAIKTIHSTKIKNIGGEIFKKRVQLIVSSLMSIKPNQTAKENEIKFQWIKPLYIDNQFLTPDLKKKMFEMFTNENYQRWLTGTKKMMLKVALANDTPTTPSPEPESTEPEQTTPVTLQQSEKPIRKLPATPTTPPAPLGSIPQSSTPQNNTPPKKAEAPQTQSMPSDLQQIGLTLVQQALVSPAVTVQATIAKIPAPQKFFVLQTIDDTQYTPIHAAASLARTDVLPILLKNLTPDQKYELITMREKDGQTPLHLAASAKAAPAKGFKPAVAVEELLKGLTPQQKKEVINIKDNDGATAIDIAQGINKAVVDILKKSM